MAVGLARITFLLDIVHVSTGGELAVAADDAAAAERCESEEPNQDPYCLRAALKHLWCRSRNFVALLYGDNDRSSASEHLLTNGTIALAKAVEWPTLAFAVNTSDIRFLTRQTKILEIECSAIGRLALLLLRGCESDRGRARVETPHVFSHDNSVQTEGEMRDE